MELSKKVISPSDIKEAILKEAQKIKRKQEIYSEVVKLNEELKNLEESVAFAGSLGFKSDSDSLNNTHHGFAQDFQNISYIAKLEKDMQEMQIETKEEEVLNEEYYKNKIKELESEIEKLKK